MPRKSSERPGNGPAFLRRLLTWRFVLGGSAVILLLLTGLMEWRSRIDYSHTARALEVRLANGSFPVAELKTAVFGLPFQTESERPGMKERSYRWPSLIKNYSVKVSINFPGQVVHMERAEPETPIQIAVDPNRPQWTPGHQLTKGLPRGYEHVVALSMDEPQRMTESLARELVRQGFLVTAEEEFGLSTLDVSLGETIPEEDNPVSFPFKMMVQTRLDQASPLPQYCNLPRYKDVLTVTITRPQIGGKQFHWEHRELVGMDLLERSSPLSEYVATKLNRKFAEVLDKAGYQPLTPKPVIAAVECADTLDVPSQFIRLRKLHQQARGAQRTPEMTADLVRVYANLGSLSDSHWNCISKVFHARALLFAQRLLAKTGETPLALAHLAYAFAMSGQPMAALQTIQRTQTASGPPAPAWLSLIEAYCKYETDVLEGTSGPEQELASYLRVRLADPFNDPDHALELIQAMLDLNPANSRVLQIAARIPQLGVQRALEEQCEAHWPVLYQRIVASQELPRSVQQMFQTAAQSDRAFTAQGYQMQRGLFDALDGASVEQQEHGITSWLMMRHLLEDESCLQAWKRLELYDVLLAVDPAPLLSDMQPLIQIHPMRRFLESFQQDRSLSVPAISEYMTQQNFRTQEMTNTPAALRAIRLLGSQTPEVNSFLGPIVNHRDQIHEDLKHYLEFAYNSQTADLYHHYCEHWPQGVAGVIEFFWDDVEKNAFDWEDKYADDPVVMNALGKKYNVLGQYDAALRCFKRSLRSSPSYATYRLVADTYSSQGDFEKWEETTKKSLKLPSFGLETARAHADLAEVMMRRDRWEEAEPHAQLAAESYSGWGLLIAAKCAEGLEEWDDAERFYRAAALRYHDSAPTWYMWCARTGRGNQAEARSVAKAYLASLAEPLTDQQRVWKITDMVLEKNYEPAIQLFRKLDDSSKSTANALYGAILADQSGDHEVRDALLTRVESKYQPEDPYSELGDLIKKVFESNQPGSWRANDFDSLILDSPFAEMPHLYFLAGSALVNHQEPELGEHYLQTAATAFDSQGIASVLAATALRLRGTNVGKIRSSIVADNIVPQVKLVSQAHLARTRGDADKQLSILNELIGQFPEFLPAYIIRAKHFEETLHFEDAMTDYQFAIEHDPEFVAPRNNLGWLYAGCPDDKIRNGQKAVDLANRVIDLQSFRKGMSLSLLAAAQAECGNFDEALKLEQQAQQLPDQDPLGIEKLNHYRAGQPYRRNLLPKPQTPQGPRTIPAK